MTLTRSFHETVAARAERDPAFRAAPIEEARQAFQEGDPQTGRALLQNVIEAGARFHDPAKDGAFKFGIEHP